MILGKPGVHMVGHFQVHAVTQFAGYRPVQVLLHVAVSDRRPLRQPASTFHDLPLEVGWPEDGVDDPEPLGVLGAQPFGEVVEFLGFAATHEPGEKPGPAVVSGERDPGEGGGQYRPRYRVAQIAGQRQRQASPAAGPPMAAIVGLGMLHRRPLVARWFSRWRWMRASSDWPAPSP